MGIKSILHLNPDEALRWFCIWQEVYIYNVER